MKDFVNQLRGKSIHIVGVTGAEGSSILRFLLKHQIKDITVHDFSPRENLEKSFKLWHRGLSVMERNKRYKQFKSDLGLVKLNLGIDYLKNIEEADLIFAPQSWRLYKKENEKLQKLASHTPFYSLTRLYLDFAPAKIIAVTGTVGKGSTANIIFRLLKLSGQKAYLAGNDTWMPQLADKLDEMKEDDFLVLEISHRQLLDGFSRAPHMVVITNLYPNHLDEVSWDEYVGLKLGLVRQQTDHDIAVVNYDIEELRVRNELKSRVVYFSEKELLMNTESVQKIYDKILNTKVHHFVSNILAGLSVVEQLGIDVEKSVGLIPTVLPLSARMELVQTVNGIKVYDDIKSTTPWATLAGAARLGKNTILICGGRSKGIDYSDFAQKIKEYLKFLIIVKSEMSRELLRFFSTGLYEEVEDINTAFNLAFQKAASGDSILISPGGGFFYSDFIKGKMSIRKLINTVTFLLPKEQV